jgi:outer membrane immunogenic protein
MLRLLLRALAMLPLAACPVNAADMPTKAPPLAVAAPAGWTGWYVGGSLGYGWHNATAGIASNTPVLAALITIGTIPSSLTTDPKGGLGGLQLGYNYQINKAVFGVEADISLADISGRHSIRNPGPILPFAIYTTTVEQRLEWFGTLRGRVGFTPFDNLLIYGTGGLAYGRTNYNGNIQRSAILLNFGVPASTDVTKTGWTVGGGVEYALSNKWSVKAEYLYYDLGNATLTGNQKPPPLFLAASSASYSFATLGNIVRVGLNFRIN